MAVHDFKSQRLFVDEPLVEAGTFDASREQANYLLNVLRLETGSRILLFNGKDGEWVSEIETTGRKKCRLTPVEQTRQQPGTPPMIYCFAPLKQARLDYMIQKAVEMGVGVLQPVITEFTQVRTLNDRRVRSNAIEAAEQCGVLNIPEIKEPISLEKLHSSLPANTPLIFCDEDAPDANELSKINLSENQPIALLIGPEGGFSASERKHLCDTPSIFKLGLGPRTLRADTAAIAALAILQSRLGDWYSRPGK